MATRGHKLFKKGTVEQKFFMQELQTCGVIWMMLLPWWALSQGMVWMMVLSQWAQTQL